MNCSAAKNSMRNGHTAECGATSDSIRKGNAHDDDDADADNGDDDYDNDDDDDDDDDDDGDDDDELEKGD